MAESGSIRLFITTINSHIVYWQKSTPVINHMLSTIFQLKNKKYNANGPEKE